MLNPELLRAGSKKQIIASHTGKHTTWADVQGKLLLFSSDRMPSRCACGIHATLALKHAREERWLEAASSSSPLSHDDMCVDPATWSSPTFDKGRIIAFLNDSAAIVVPNEPGICNLREQAAHTSMQLSTSANVIAYDCQQQLLQRQSSCCNAASSTSCKLYMI